MNKIQEVIKEFFGQDIDFLGPYQSIIEDMAKEIIELRKRNADLGWLEAPDRMGSQYNTLTIAPICATLQIGAFHFMRNKE